MCVRINRVNCLSPPSKTKYFAIIKCIEKINNVGGFMFPPIEQWIVLADAAKKLGVKPSQVHHARKYGRRTRDKRLVVLECWKTLRGYVTTSEAIEKFHNELNS